MICILEKTHARVVDGSGTSVATFERDGDLYACTMKVQRPEARNAPDFVRPVR